MPVVRLPRSCASMGEAGFDCTSRVCSVETSKLSDAGVVSAVRLSSSSDETERSEMASSSLLAGDRPKRNASAGGTGAIVPVDVLDLVQKLQAEAAAILCQHCSDLVEFVRSGREGGFVIAMGWDECRCSRVLVGQNDLTVFQYLLDNIEV